ncbi:MAG TPA: hypothetical protein VND80_06430 [Steroidobacteraceae bacterium]|nr:hypothetical protein [Steroidobacteraceae bacterium]
MKFLVLPGDGIGPEIIEAAVGDLDRAYDGIVIDTQSHAAHTPANRGGQNIHAAFRVKLGFHGNRRMRAFTFFKFAVGMVDGSRHHARGDVGIPPRPQHDSVLG